MERKFGFPPGATAGAADYTVKRVTRMEIAIALDTYDDLFSDFDVRGYAERALSKDFLDELYIRLRRHWNQPDLDIVFLISAAGREVEDEKLIIERLSQFRIERRDHNLTEGKKARLKALLFVAIGLALSVAANVVVERFDFIPLSKDFLLIPSWFFVWSGFDLFIKRGEFGQKKRYYAALSRARIAFRGIDG